jgi:hypothetical protein
MAEKFRIVLPESALPFVPSADRFIVFGDIYRGIAGVINKLVSRQGEHSTIDPSSQDSEYWHIFFRVWNSHNQLIYLTAFLNRRLLAEHDKYQLEDTERNSLEQRLNSLERQTRHKWADSGTPPNPYYGG